MKAFGLIVFMATLINSTVSGQKLIWNPTQEIKANKEHWFAGNLNGKSYHVFSNDESVHLVEYSNNYSISKIFNLETAKEISLAFIANNKLHIVQSSKVDEKKIRISTYTVESFDVDGKKSGSKVLFEIRETELDIWDLNKEMRKNVSYDYDAQDIEPIVLSPNQKFLGIHFITNRYFKDPKNQLLIFETENFKEVKKIDLSGEINSQCFLMDNGDVITLQGDAETHYQSEPLIDLAAPLKLNRYSSSGDKKPLEIALKGSEGQSRNGLFHKISEDHKFLYIAINLANYKPGKFNLNLSKEATAAIQYNKVNTETMELVESKVVAIDQQLIESAGNSKKGGIPKLRTIDICENTDGFLLIGQLREQIKDQRGDVDFDYKDLFVFKHSNTASVQKQFKVNFSKWHPGFNTLFYKDHLYMIYNDGLEPKTEIKVVKLNDKLEILNTVKEKTWQSHKIYINPWKNLKLEENKYVLLGRMQKYVGTALLELD